MNIFKPNLLYLERILGKKIQEAHSDNGTDIIAMRKQLWEMGIKLSFL